MGLLPLGLGSASYYTWKWQSPAVAPRPPAPPPFVYAAHTQGASGGEPLVWGRGKQTFLSAQYFSDQCRAGRRPRGGLTVLMFFGGGRCGGAWPAWGWRGTARVGREPAGRGGGGGQGAGGGCLRDCTPHAPGLALIFFLRGGLRGGRGRNRQDVATGRGAVGICRPGRFLEGDPGVGPVFLQGGGTKNGLPLDFSDGPKGVFFSLGAVWSGGERLQWQGKSWDQTTFPN